MDLVPVDHNPFPAGVTGVVPVDHDPFAPQSALAKQVSGFPQRAADLGMAALGPIGEAGMTVGDMLRTGHVDPRDIPQVVGGVMMGVAAPEAEEAAPLEAGAEAVAKGITAYHGSPYDFDKFDLSKIGTGEGAQAYGHGLYFAENPGVAQGYRDALTQGPTEVENLDGERFSPDSLSGAEGLAARAALKYSDEFGWKEFIDRNSQNKDEADTAFSLLKNGELRAAYPGRTYQVSINADPEHFLDWDKPLSEQPQALKDALPQLIQQYGGDLGRIMGANGQLRSAVSGQEVYQGIAKALAGNKPFARNPPQAADVLRQAGIPGIKYLDQGSRGSGNGTSNYVVFDDKLIDIIKKYGMAGLIAGGGAHFATQPVDHDPFAQ